MSFNFTDGGAGTQASHNCDKVFGIDFAFLLPVIQGEALLELCNRNKESNGLYHHRLFNLANGYPMLLKKHLGFTQEQIKLTKSGL